MCRRRTDEIHAISLRSKKKKKCLWAVFLRSLFCPPCRCAPVKNRKWLLDNGCLPWTALVISPFFSVFSPFFFFYCCCSLFIAETCSLASRSHPPTPNPPPPFLLASTSTLSGHSDTEFNFASLLSCFFCVFLLVVVVVVVSPLSVTGGMYKGNIPVLKGAQLTHIRLLP